MSLSLREKQSLYHGLAQLVGSGVPFPAALDKLVVTTRGATRRLVEAARQSLAAGHTVAEAFAANASLVSPLEIAIISAVEKSGQLHRGLRELSDYFGALHQARQSIKRRCAYPVFLLHFAILAFNVPALIIGKDPQLFGRHVLTSLFFVYGLVLIIALAIPLLREIGADNAGADRVLNLFPVIGNIRRSFALSRFCTVFGLHLDAGINVMDSVITAGRSSLSGMVRSAVDSALPKIRGGSQVGPLLAASGAFPTDLTQAVIVGEETGSLDEELRRLSAEFRDKALTALEVFADWLPKVVYFSVLMYLAWKIIQLALGYFAMIESFSK